MKKGRLWLVLLERDGLYEKVYAGDQKSKAREYAAKALADKKLKEGERISVFRGSIAAVLTADSLIPQLPKEAF